MNSINTAERLFIIKIGGNIIDDENALKRFLAGVAAIDAKKILIHGGGKIATKIGEQLGIRSHYTGGRRITDAETVDLVTMVYGGLINKKIVAQLQALQCNAIGLTGADGDSIPANKRPVTTIDYGFAGDVDSERLDITPWQLLLDNGYVPVVAPLTHDGKGQLLNTNADTIASAVAVALSAKYIVRLIYCFEKKGVLQDIADEDSVIGRMTRETYKQLLQQGQLADGILPKIDNAFAAIEKGVQEVLVGEAGDLLSNCGTETKGTLFT